MKKEDYIKKEIDRCEKLKLNFQSMVDSQNAKITSLENLSDEEYEKILEHMRMEEEEDSIEELEVINKLEKLGITLEELDNMSIDDVRSFHQK